LEDDTSDGKHHDTFSQRATNRHPGQGLDKSTSSMMYSPSTSPFWMMHFVVRSTPSPQIATGRRPCQRDGEVYIFDHILVALVLVHEEG
jgi:hypothetical protein